MPEKLPRSAGDPKITMTPPKLEYSLDGAQPSFSFKSLVQNGLLGESANFAARPKSEELVQTEAERVAAKRAEIATYRQPSELAVLQAIIHKLRWDQRQDPEWTQLFEWPLRRLGRMWALENNNPEDIWHLVSPVKVAEAVVDWDNAAPHQPDRIFTLLIKPEPDLVARFSAQEAQLAGATPAVVQKFEQLDPWYYAIRIRYRTSEQSRGTSTSQPSPPLAITVGLLPQTLVPELTQFMSSALEETTLPKNASEFPNNQLAADLTPHPLIDPQKPESQLVQQALLRSVILAVGQEPDNVLSREYLVTMIKTQTPKVLDQLDTLMFRHRPDIIQSLRHKLSGLKEFDPFLTQMNWAVSEKPSVWSSLSGTRLGEFLPPSLLKDLQIEMVKVFYSNLPIDDAQVTFGEGWILKPNMVEESRESGVKLSGYTLQNPQLAPDLIIRLQQAYRQDLASPYDNYTRMKFFDYFSKNPRYVSETPLDWIVIEGLMSPSK